MRKIFSLLLVLVLLHVSVFAFATEAEEEVSFPGAPVDQPMDNPNTGSDQTDTSQTADPQATETPAPTEAPVVNKSGVSVITISAVGDLTIGTNYKAYRNMSGSIFGKELKKQDGEEDFFLRNIKNLLLEDDLTIANFEGTLADKVTVPANKRENSYLFLAPTSYKDVLVKNGIEAVSLENNHVYDFGEDGYNSTVNALTEGGVVYSGPSILGVYETQGIKIGMLSYQTFNGGYDKIYQVIETDIQNARNEGCDLVIVNYHWGAELDYHPNANQKKLAYATIDAGADLILGHHSHRINPIEEYNGKYIVYSLGNFSFAGHSKPSDMCTYVFQIRFKYKDGELNDSEFRIVPCRISSKQDYNDFAVTPLTEKRNIDTVLSLLQKHGEYLKNPVPSYPLEWN